VDDIDSSERATDIRSVTALRLAVERAMTYTSAGAGLSLPDLNEIEWQIGRSFCQREGALCFGPPRDDKPVDSALLKVADGACPFIGVCRGSSDPKTAALVEPRLAEHHAFY
jgi:hypothetical protein